MAFSETCHQGFLGVLQFPPFLHRSGGSTNDIKLKIDAISALVAVIAVAIIIVMTMTGSTAGRGSGGR